ncbi:MAG TPA: hypothetical protein VFK16_00565 [Gemmatimonadaceae bacterium]|jgi:hypothetical protein|nr:hypothetical protein [Gemmatimonadaceae bacterium]
MRRVPLLIAIIAASTLAACGSETIIVPPPFISSDVEYLRVHDGAGRDTVDVSAGQTVQLTADGLDGALRVKPVNWVTHWLTSDDGIATVDSTGLVTTTRTGGNVWIIAWINPDSSSSVTLRDSALVRIITPT